MSISVSTDAFATRTPMCMIRSEIKMPTITSTFRAETAVLRTHVYKSISLAESPTKTEAASNGTTTVSLAIEEIYV